MRCPRWWVLLSDWEPDWTSAKEFVQASVKEFVQSLGKGSVQTSVKEFVQSSVLMKGYRTGVFPEPGKEDYLPGWERL